MIVMMEMMCIIFALGTICVSIFLITECFLDCRDYIKQEKDGDSFEHLMLEMLELDASRLKAQEDLLREACRSWAETDEGTEADYSGDYDEDYDEEVDY